MRNLLVAAAMLAVFAIAAAGSNTSVQQQTDTCQTECCGACCDTACK